MTDNTYISNKTLEDQWIKWYVSEANKLEEATRYYNQDQVEILTYLNYLKDRPAQDFTANYNSYVQLLENLGYLTEIATISDILDNPIIAYVSLGNLQLVNPLQAFFTIL